MSLGAGDGARTAIGVRLHRLLLRIYPASFRQRYGDEMARCFIDRARRLHGRSGVRRFVGIWPSAVCDVVTNGLGERMREAGLKRRGVRVGCRACMLHPGASPDARRPAHRAARGVRLRQPDSLQL